MLIRGVLTALITPFRDDVLDEIGLSNNVQDQLNAGIDGLVVLGTTGEAPTLTDKESERAISITVETVGGQIPVVVGTGHNCTRDTIASTRTAKQLGANAALVVIPYYNRPNQEGLLQHIEAITEAIDFPIILYNNPIRTGVSLHPETLSRLATNTNIIGIKDCSGSMIQAAQYVRAVPRENFTLFSGDDVTAVPYISIGARGLISTISNLIPEQMVELIHAMLAGNWEQARLHHHELFPLFEAAMLDSNPMPIKAMMQLCGKPAGNCRLPMSQVSAAVLTQIENVLESLSVEPNYD